MESTFIYREAKRRVERKIGLYTHAAVYVVVNASLVLLNLFIHPGKWWSLAPLFGWGIGLLFHASAVLLKETQSGWKQRNYVATAQASA